MLALELSCSNWQANPNRLYLFLCVLFYSVQYVFYGTGFTLKCVFVKWVLLGSSIIQGVSFLYCILSGCEYLNYINLLNVCLVILYCSYFNLKKVINKVINKMVLMLNGVAEDRPLDCRSFFISYPEFKERASKFTAIPSKVIGPAGVLYVQQREFAATLPSDKNVDILGSDDATTCIIVVIRHVDSGAIALTHLDGFVNTENALCSMLQRLQKLSPSSPGARFEIQLIGGFLEEHGDTPGVFGEILSSCSKQPVEVHLTLACVGEKNTTIRRGKNMPIVYGVGLDIKTGEIFPATFSDKGPDATMRQARCFAGNDEVFEIYDSKTGILRVGPFYFESPSDELGDLLSKSDEYILEACSTSPEVEPPHFVAEAKAALSFLHFNKISTIPEFKQNRPRLYKRDFNSGTWKLLVS